MSTPTGRPEPLGKGYIVTTITGTSTSTIGAPPSEDRQMLDEAMDLLRLHRQWKRLTQEQQNDAVVRGYTLYDRYAATVDVASSTEEDDHG